MPLRPHMEFDEYLDLFGRRKWWIVFTFLLVLYVTTVICVLLPDLYKSTTRILVIPPRVPESLVRSTVAYDLNERLAAIQLEVLSRDRILAVAEELGLFPKQRNTLPPESFVKLVQKRTQIRVDRKNDTIQLSFSYEDPLLAMNAASKLASYFIDENYRVRGQLVADTSAFLASQLNETRRKLEAQEEKLKAYKTAYLGELPQQMQSNLNLLLRLQEQLRTNAESTARAEDRKVLVETAVVDLERRIVTREAEASSEGPAGAREDEDLGARKRKLEALRLKYTERHPLVEQLRREIEQKEQGPGGFPETDGEAIPPLSPAGSSGAALRSVSKEREELRRLHGRARELELQVQSLRREKEGILKSMNDLQDRVDRLPQREQEMIALTRDYDNLKRTYDELQKKKTEAEISGNLEARQEGEQFRILDPADLPTVPSEPNRLRIAGIAMLVFLAIAFGGPVLREMQDLRLRDAREFRHFVAIPVLAALPVIRDSRFQRRVRWRRWTVAGGLAAFAGAYGGLIAAHGERIKFILKTLGGIP